MIRSLAQLFDECWPGVDFPTQCAVTKMRDHGHDALDAVIDLVVQGGGGSALASRLKNKHPVAKEHLDQYDSQLDDVLTEAMAFAWVVVVGLGAPRFSDDLGIPDIEVPGTAWVEAKAIHLSDVEWAEIRDGLKSPEGFRVRVGSPKAQPEPGLLKKVDDAWVKALSQFSKAPHLAQAPIVWMHIRAFDWPLADDPVWELIREWGEGVLEDGTAHLVLVDRENWRAPRFSSMLGPRFDQRGRKHRLRGRGSS